MTKNQRFLSRIKDDLKPEQLLPSLNAGFLNSILLVIFEISLAAMLFRGDLAVFIPRGIGLTLFGSFIMGLICTLTSSYPGTAFEVQDAPVVILSLMVTAIAGSMPPSVSSSDLFYTLVAAIGVSTILTGVLFMLMGYFKLGNLIRFIPYPVIGGFMAGIGWLLFKGGIGAMTDSAVTFSQAFSLFAPHLLLKWLPGFVLGGILFFATKRFRNSLLIPSILVGGVLIFYLILVLSGVTIAQAGVQGWLLGPFKQGSLWQPMTPKTLAHVHWDVILGHINSMGTIFLISVVSLLLNASGLELTVRQDMDLNRELKSTGLANFFGGFGGSPAGYISLSLSSLGYRLGSKSRLAGLISASLCGAVLIFGTHILSYFPKPIAGAILVYMGLDFLYEWIYLGWRKLPTADFLIILIILFVIGVVGLLEGVAVGLVVAIILFILNYSQVNVVKYVLTGRNYRSNVERAAPYDWILNEEGEQLHIIKLQGYIFFGTAQKLFDQVKVRLDSSSQLSLRYLIFDFRHVTGIDSSTLNGFEKMKQLCESREITLVFTEISRKLLALFEKEGFLKDAEDVVKIFPDLDHGVEWGEDQILNGKKKGTQETEGDIDEKNRRDRIFESTYDALMKALEQQAVFEELLKDMAEYLEYRDVEKGNILIQQGEPVPGIFFIESGQVNARFENEEGKQLRLMKMGPGSLVGNQEIYSESHAIMTVVASRLSRIFLLSHEALKRLEASDPTTATKLHRFVAGYTGRRLVNLVNTVSAILR